MRVDALILGDVIVERDRKKDRPYKVTSIGIAACSPCKTHVQVDGTLSWCYDSAAIVTVQR